MGLHHCNDIEGFRKCCDKCFGGPHCCLWADAKGRQEQGCQRCGDYQSSEGNGNQVGQQEVRWESLEIYICERAGGQLTGD